MSKKLMRLLCAWLALLLAACAVAPPAPPSLGVPLGAAALAQPERHVVVTVHNQPAAPNGYAGSTPRGYAGAGPYRASSAALALARGVAASHGLREVAAWPIELLGLHCLVYELAAGAPREQVLAELRRDARVESAQPLAGHELHAAANAAGYNDPYAGLQRNLLEMGVAAAQRWSRGAGVRVALVDTGADIAHPDFGQRPLAADLVADGRTGAEGHGTAVAGVIGALPNNGIGIVGIAPEAQLLSLRGCWSAGAGRGQCNSFTLAQALIAALDAKAGIVNLSLGGPADALLQRIVERGLQRGVLFIGAAPPSGRREGFPTGIAGVIAVDAAEPGRAPLPGLLYAPGVDVFTLAPGGRYDAISGSSIAAAQVSGIAALLLARRPGLAAAELEGLLRRSMPGAADAGRGLVNACTALRSLLAQGARWDCPDSGAALAGGR